MIARILLLIALGLSAPAAAGNGALIVAGGAWAAVDRGSSCEAVARSARVAAKGKVQPLAAFTFTPDHRRWGEFHVTLRRVTRPGASVMLTIDQRPFLLAARGMDAWSTGPAQEQAIIAALRLAATMRVEARDGSGGRFVDSFAIDGAATAIDAAAARCAGKTR